MTTVIKNWKVTFKDCQRVYARNNDFTKEGVISYKIIAGVVVLSDDAKHLPKYVREAIKKLALRGGVK